MAGKDTSAFRTAPIWNNPESEVAHQSAVAVPYCESKSFDRTQYRSEISPNYGPAKGETWKCDSDVQYWKDGFIGNLYSNNMEDGYRLNSSNGKIHDGFVEVGSYRQAATVQNGNCMFWPLATASNHKNGIKGFSFYVRSKFHSGGGTNSDGTNAFRHNTWLRAAGVTLQGISKTGDAGYSGPQKIWGSDVICTDGSDTPTSPLGVPGKHVNITFTNDFFAEAQKMHDNGYLPIITNFIFQVWTGYRNGIDTGSAVSTLYIWDFKLHYTFGPESANSTKSLLLPAWSDDPRTHHKYSVPLGWSG